MSLNFDAIKVNVVAMRGLNDDVKKKIRFDSNYNQELCDFVEFVKDKPIEVRFIEFMPFDQNDWSNKKLIPYFEIRNII